MNKARIVKLIGGLYTIQDLKTKETFVSKASGKLRYVRLDETSSFNVQTTQRTKRDIQRVQLSPKVGDIVLYDKTDDNKPIQEILPRTNELSRPDVANVDQIILIFSTKEPDFSFNLLDQFLVLVEKSTIKPIIVISKIDLMEENEFKDLKKEIEYYRTIGYEIHYINSKQKLGFDTLIDIFEDKVTVIAGQTGVGKSTMLNALMPDLNLRTQQISHALGRGKHTTRHSELYEYGKGLIADTPGFSKLNLNIFDKSELKHYFIEFADYSDDCRFKNSCNHINEPDCNVKDNKKILKSRIENYTKFFNEIKDQKEKY